MKRLVCTIVGGKAKEVSGYSSFRDKAYIVVWHGVNPRLVGIYYSLETAREAARKYRKKHPFMAITISKEIDSE